MEIGVKEADAEINFSLLRFITLYGQVHQQNSRAEWNSAGGFLSSLDAQALRQLRIVDMLFELSVSLMRVLELTIAIAPDIFLDWQSRDTAETLAIGLIQVTTLILEDA